MQGVSMLDDSSYISRFDSDDALGVIASQFSQLLQKYEVEVGPHEPIRGLVVAGMGGSALGASLLPVWPGVSVPFEISRSYDIPAWVDNGTLVVASSYSGNTEETVAALKSAKDRGAQIAVIAAGGELEKLAAEFSCPFVQLPAGLQPRMAPFYNFKALLTLLVSYSLVDRDFIEELESTATKMADKPRLWGPSVPTIDNLAKQLAEHCVGKTPIVYGGLLYPAAYKWKINFNENAKNTAWCGQYSEFNHNEFLGWSSHPIEKPFAVFDLISSFDHPQIQKRFVISDKLLSGKRPKAKQIHAEGETVLEQLLWTVALGDMVSVYLALLNGVNPTPVDLIEKLKKEL